MRKTPVSRPMPRRPSTTALALIGTVLLAIPVISFAQSPGPHGPAMQGDMQGSGPHMQGSGPGMQGAGPAAKDAKESAAPPMSRHVERFMMLYDLNGDGKVTIDEINADQSRMFKALDINDDKSLSVDEIRRRGRSLQLFRTTTLFDLLDTNGDGKLSVDEIEAPSKRWFKRYDTNGDGVLEANEIPARRSFRGSDRGRH